MYPDLTAQVAGLHIQLLDTDARINTALDRGSRREFRVWCKRRASLAARLQTLLVTAATHPEHGMTTAL
jgi:hypothetical protein